MERRANREDVIGRQVGRYTIVGHLATGGMAELYIARQEAVGGFEKNLVVKVLQARYAQHPRVERMFLDEARLAAKLNHPSIVHVYDVAEEDGSKFIAMEYIHGETLTDIIKRGVEVGNFLPLEHAVHIVSQVAAGLDYAHRRHDPNGGLLRIVHRDVSPSNIMVSYEGQTKIIDFGIARVQDQIREESGMHPGKASYMSPEQVAGEPVDYRSDIFSLGIILYEITLGPPVVARAGRGGDEAHRSRRRRAVEHPPRLSAGAGGDRDEGAAEAAGRSPAVGRRAAARPGGVPRRRAASGPVRGKRRSICASCSRSRPRCPTRGSSSPRDRWRAIRRRCRSSAASAPTAAWGWAAKRASASVSESVPGPGRWGHRFCAPPGRRCRRSFRGRGRDRRALAR